MPVGSNLGNQPNVLVFEVLHVLRGEAPDVPPTVTTLSVHPLVVGPSSIRYNDGTRSVVQQTLGSAVVTKGGRTLRSVSLSGTFGVESRGLGPYIGTGAQRFQRFYHEVVRLSDAVTRAQVDAERSLLRSPGLSGLILPRTFDPERSSFSVNFYDLWHRVSFEALIQGFSFDKSMRGGAAGLTQYSLSLQEVGPIVTAGISNQLVRGLFDGLSVWETVNDTLRSYRLDSVVDALVAGANVPLTSLASSIGAFKAQAAGATAVVNGYSDTLRPIVQNQTSSLVEPDSGTTIPDTDVDPVNGSGTLMSHLGYAARIAATGRSVLDALVQQGPPPRVTAPAGQVAWSEMRDGVTLPGLDAVDRVEDLVAVVASAEFQPAAGALYGMGREDFAGYITGTGTAGRSPSLAGTLTHVVTAYDTAVSLERRYGVTFDEILRLNDVLPDEALTTGRTLLVPQSRAIATPAQIDGLPVFGSHAGREAWGRDLYADLRTDANGDLLVCSGEDVLVQGIDWLVDTFAGDLEELAAEVPEVVQGFVLEQRLVGILLSDRRFVSVESIDVVRGDEGASLRISVVVQALNGGTVAA